MKLRVRAVPFRIIRWILVRLFQVGPWKYREESTMSDEAVAPEMKDVTVKLLATVDLVRLIFVMN